MSRCNQDSSPNYKKGRWERPRERGWSGLSLSPCTRVFLRVLRFSYLHKTNISKFQFYLGTLDLEPLSRMCHCIFFYYSFTHKAFRSDSKVLKECHYWYNLSNRVVLCSRLQETKNENKHIAAWLKNYKATSGKIIKVNDMFADRQTCNLPSFVLRELEKEVISCVWPTLTRAKIFIDSLHCYLKQFVRPTQKMSR